MSPNVKYNSSEPVCYLCSSKAAKLRRDRIRYGVEKNVFECDNCNLVYLWPREKEEKTTDFYKKGFRDLPRTQLGLAVHDPNDIFSSRLGQAKRRYEMIKPYINSSTSLLEIGSAAGSFLSLVKPVVKKCTAIELDPIFADYIRKKLDIDVIEEPVEKMNNDVEKFDAICMWHVLEHLHDPIDTIKKLLSLLNRDGYLFVEVPNIWDPLLTLYRLKAYDDFYYQLPHLFCFSPLTLGKVFEKSGFQTKIIPIQLYGLNNHLRWLFLKRPQSHQPKGKIGLLNVFDRLYRYFLEKTERTDTIFAIFSKSGLQDNSL